MTQTVTLSVDIERLRRLAPRFMARYEAEKAAEADVVTDPVAPDAPGAIEIGFDRTLHPNCSTVLWDNLDRNSDKPAVTGPTGDLTYRALCARAAKWGNALRRAGLAPGSRIVEFVADLPKTGTGKIDRQALRSAASKRVR